MTIVGILGPTRSRELGERIGELAVRATIPPNQKSAELLAVERFSIGSRGGVP
jgi:hypothetical protein